jgi:hypothetical protein
MLGFDDPKMLELMRLYIKIRTDHGGNVSAHAGHLAYLFPVLYLDFSGLVLPPLP